jgi:hypothetical protein
MSETITERCDPIDLAGIETEASQGIHLLGILRKAEWSISRYIFGKGNDTDG